MLLVEYGAESDERARRLRRQGRTRSSPATRRSSPIEFTREAEEIELAWRVREGLHGLIGRLRLPGTALIVEDVCVPPERIAEGARDLQALLGEHGFLPGVAGHASAGNLHFMLTPDFAKQEDLERYEAFMGKLVELIVGKYDGSLKAEHGTGINMAPYVEREWGEKATELMWRVKRLADPDGVLNPGVVLNRDPDVHLRNLKTTPAIEESATTCVECGFCEPVCPSRNLTTTPRQRIVLRREMARQPDGLAGPAGPAGGVRVRLDRDLRRRRLLPARLPGRDRHRQAGQGTAHRSATRRAAERAALAAAKRWGAVEKASRAGLRLGGPLARRTKRGQGPAGPRDGRSLPPTSARAPPPSTSPPAPTASSAPPPTGPKVEIRSLRPVGPRSLVEALVEVSRRAGLPVWIPDEVAGSCCGLPWSSKGFGDAHRHKANEMVERLWDWSGEGELPVVIDAASCTQGVAEPGEGVLTEAERRAARGARDPRLGRLGARPPAAEARDRRARSARPPSTRPARPATWASRRACALSPAPSPRTSTSPPRRPAAASPATAASPTPS